MSLYSVAYGLILLTLYLGLSLLMSCADDINNYDWIDACEQNPSVDPKCAGLSW